MLFANEDVRATQHAKSTFQRKPLRRLESRAIEADKPDGVDWRLSRCEIFVDADSGRNHGVWHFMLFRCEQ